MTSSALRAGALGCALLATTALTAPAYAAPPPRFLAVDDNGVDLVTGRRQEDIPEGSIGSGDGGLELRRVNGSDDQWSGLLYRATIGGVSQMVVELGRTAETFTISGTTYTSTMANGGALVYLGSNSYRYTSRDGTKITYVTKVTDQDDPFSPLYPVTGGRCIDGDAGTCGIPMAIVRPNGMTYTLNWNIVTRCGGLSIPCPAPAAYFRLDSLTTSANYSFNYNYVTDDPGASVSNPPQTNWFVRTGATMTNIASPPSPTPTITYANPSSGVTEITDTAGRVWRLTAALDGSYRIRRPGSASDNIIYTFNAGVVTSVTRDGVVTNYSRSVSGSTGTLTITNARSEATVVTSDLDLGRVTSVRDPQSHTTSYQYDSNGRLTRVTYPELNYIAYTYDARGNVTETRMRDKAGNSLNDIVTTASFPASCTNVVTCNQPNSTTDARGHTTDYTYDATHGGVLTVTAPAPTGTSPRPQTRYTYSTVGSVYRLTAVSACQMTASCSGTADEVKTTIGYDLPSRLPNSVTSANGTGTVTSTTAYTYDNMGNLLTVDGPLAGTADTTRFRYDSARRRIGTVGPDPDGAGALHNRARRITYRDDDQVSSIEVGTVNSQSDADWAAFSQLQRVDIGFDTNSRPTTQRLISGSTTYALSQTSYDNVGRAECVAQRMNPAEFASPPSTACSLDTAGSFGPDRITRTSYDTAGRVNLVQTGYGVAGVEADEVATTYTNNGQVLTVEDANDNRTTYAYDGHDRLEKTSYPSPATDHVSSASDYEQLTLDANGNVTNRRLRDGQNIGYTYDNLDRVISKNLPGTEPDVTYTYDLIGRMLTASQTGNALGFTYDALGRNLTQSGPLGTASYQYDAAGRRTRLTYPGTGLYVDYDYLVTGEVTKIRENGATTGVGVLSTYSYDSLGRRDLLTRGNGTTTDYSYDSVSRLSQLVQNLTGTTNDLTLGFSYNPASQITSNTRSNDAYAWTDHYQVNRAYAANGLNQYTQSGLVVPDYDDRGNLISAGGATFTYSSENRLVAATGGVTLSYDPLLRLYQTVGAGVTTRLAYDGQSLIAEYNSSSGLLRRYVHGPGVDEPLVWYEGTGTTDPRWFHADERGSMVAITNDTGVVTNSNTYDEYGIPATSNVGRFQYTGQQWLTDLGMYHYRTRIYSPTFGRFLQADPTGFVDGLSLYTYVHNDPVNIIDPNGTDGETIVVVGSRCRVFVTCISGDSFDMDDLQNIGAGHGPPAVGGGGANNPPPNQDENEDTEEEFEKDLQRCRSLRDAGARSRCFESANERDFARRNGRDVPELVTWREISTLAAIGIALYWIISETSRLFPPRNLIPVP